MLVLRLGTSQLRQALAPTEAGSLGWSEQEQRGPYGGPEPIASVGNLLFLLFFEGHMMFFFLLFMSG